MVITHVISYRAGFKSLGRMGYGVEAILSRSMERRRKQREVERERERNPARRASLLQQVREDEGEEEEGGRRGKSDA